MSKSGIVIGSGYKPDYNSIKFLQNIGFNDIIAADGGAEYLRINRISPTRIIGDLDSITVNTLKCFKNKCEIIKYSRQNDTDIEKCIKHCLKLKYDRIALISVVGSRLDHSIANLGLLRKYFKKIKIVIIHDDSILIPYYHDVVLNSILNETVSIFSLTDSSIITTKGLKYEMRNKELSFGLSDSLSNLAINNKISLEIKKGAVILIRPLSSVIKIGNI